MSVWCFSVSFYDLVVHLFLTLNITLVLAVAHVYTFKHLECWKGWWVASGLWLPSPAYIVISRQAWTTESGCFKIRVCLLYGYQHFDFFPFTCWWLSWLFANSAQYYLIDSHIGMYDFIYILRFIFICVCECESVGIQRTCGGQRTTFLASVCSFYPVLEAGFLIFPTGCICEGLGDYPISIFYLAVRVLGLGLQIRATSDFFTWFPFLHSFWSLHDKNLLSHWPLFVCFW